MNIAYIHTGQWPSNSPSFTFVTLNAIALAEYFSNIYLFVKKNNEEPTENILKNNFDLVQPKNLHIELIETSKIVKTNLLYGKKIVKKLKELVENKNLDIIITRNSRMLKFLLPFKLNNNVKLYYEAHDFYADLSLRNDIDIKKNRKEEKNEQTYLPHVTGIICLQNEQKEIYEKVFPTVKCYLARTGLQKVLNKNEEKKYLTYIGSLDQHKGILQLLKALGKSESKPHLLIIGGKNDREIESVKKEVSKYYEDSLVTITGWVNNKDLRKYLRQTAIGIVPLTDTFFNRFLTSPLKLFDYYSYSIPVIASDLPTSRELVLEGMTGFFFEEGNEQDLASTIDKLFSNKTLIDKMRYETYKHAHRFLWKNRAKAQYKIFKNKLHEKKN